jgi:hypothetical protein
VAVLTELLGTLALAVFIMGSLTLGYHRQGYEAGAGAAEPISGLMFFTLGADILVAAGSFLYFLRHRRRREIAQHAVSEAE